jgi:hypothetical protein
MAEQLLNGAEIRSAFKEMSSKRVAQHVRRHLPDSSLYAKLAKNAADGPRVYGCVQVKRVL